MDYFQESLKMHEKFGGKMEIVSKVPLENKEDLSLAYTPGVAESCLEIAKDKSNAYKYTIKKNLVAVITDGSAVLGLGNIGGIAGLPVMEGKCLLLKRFGNVDAFPICLDTQDTEEIIQTVKNIAPTFGGINLEDISAPRCFEIEERLINELNIPVFHDDQHGTAIVVLAGIINALKVSDRDIRTSKFVFSGSGAAGMATAKILMSYGAKNIIICDRKGAIYKGREDLNPVKEEMAKETNQNFVKGTLADALDDADVFIGLSSSNIVTAEMIKKMKPDPIIFAMANPTPEIMPEEAKNAGVRFMATGRSDFPNQVNNILAFPGIFRAVLDCGAKKITNEMKIAASVAIAGMIKEPTPEKFIPSIFDEGVLETVVEAVKNVA